MHPMNGSLPPGMASPTPTNQKLSCPKCPCPHAWHNIAQFFTCFTPHLCKAEASADWTVKIRRHVPAANGELHVIGLHGIGLHYSGLCMTLP